MTELTYARAGVCPCPFPFGKIKVFDLDTDQQVLDVFECDAAAGWLVSYRRNSEGQFYIDPADPGRAAIQRVEGRFKIVVAE